MAITRVGLAGPSASYLAFQPKATALIYAVPDVDVTSILFRGAVRTILDRSPDRSVVSRNPIRTVEPT